jgi:hypothetical protein
MAENLTYQMWGSGIERAENAKYVFLRIAKDSPTINTTLDDEGNPKNHIVGKSGGFQPAQSDGPLRVNVTAMRSARLS